MKKLFALLAMLVFFFVSSPVFAQGDGTDVNTNLENTENVVGNDATDNSPAPVSPAPADTVAAKQQAIAAVPEKTAMEKLIGFCLEHLNYGTVTLFMAIESSFIPFPSEAVVPPAAWKAATSGDMNVVLVVIFATLGAIIGALVNYYLALWLGRPIIYRFARSRFGHMCLLDEDKVKHAEDYFEKHGAVSTFFGRLVPAVRQLISIPAGLVRMKMSRFLLFTALGAGAVHLKVEGAFGVTHLRFGHTDQVGAQIAGIGIICKHGLPLQRRFQICLGVGIAIEAVDMLLLSADQLIALHTFGVVLMLLDPTGGAVGNGNACHAQIPYRDKRHDQ